MARAQGNEPGRGPIPARPAPGTTMHTDLRCEPIGQGVAANKGWGQRFNPKAGFTFKFPKGFATHVFLDDRITSGDAKQVNQTIEEGVVAHIITCEGNEWHVRSEPLGDGRFGLAIYTDDGRAMMSGSGEVSEDGSYTAHAQTLYAGIRNASKITTTVSCTGKSDGSYSCTGSASKTW